MEKNIIKDPIRTNEKSFSIGNLVLGSFCLLIIVVILLSWGIIIDKKRKAPLIIEDGTGDKLDIQEVKTSQARSGYSYSGLGQACEQDDVDDGLPNLPDSYRTQGCDKLKKHVCVPGLVKGGGICLSQLGGSCKSLYDCNNDATICLNEICSNERESLNQPCIRQNDCSKLQLEGRGSNNICDSIKGVCKVNYYPYDSGCTIADDCLTGDEFNTPVCLKLIGEGIILTATFNGPVDNGEKFEIEKGDLNTLKFLKVGMFVNINFEKFKYPSSKIIEWKPDFVKSSGTFIIGNTIDNELEGEEAEIVLGVDSKGEIRNICVSGIPVGLPQYEIGGTEVPCEAGLRVVNGYCVKNDFTVDYGGICNRETAKILNCSNTEETIDGDEVTLTCLDSQTTVNNYKNNFNANFETIEDSIPFLGICSYPIKNESEQCNDSINDCKPPYLCISLTDRLGVPVSLCKNKFGKQFCIDDSYCNKGFKCVNHSCLSIENNICFEDQDCKNESCSSKQIFLYYFDIDSNSYIQLNQMFGNHIGNINIRFSSNINRTTNLPSKIICWSVSEAPLIDYPRNPINGYDKISPNTYNGQQAIIDVLTHKEEESGYDQVTLTVNLYPDSDTAPDAISKEIKDIILDSDNNIMTVFSKPIETYRKRIDSITAYSYGADMSLEDITVGYNSGYLNTGEIVMYVPANPDRPLIDPSVQYKITLELDKEYPGQQFINTIEITTLTGGKPIIKNTFQTGDLIGNLFSWSNKYNIQTSMRVGQPTPDRWPLLMKNTFQTGDRIYINNIPDGWELVIDTLSSKSETQNVVKLVKNNYLYLIKTSFSSSFKAKIYTGDPDMYNYVVTDDYYASQGSVPFLKGKKSFYQRIFFYKKPPSPESYPLLNFELYRKMINYGIVLVSETVTAPQYIEKTELYNYVNEEWKINGLNDSFSYNFDSQDLSLDVFKDKNGINNILIKTRLNYLIEAEEKNKELTVVQKINYQVNPTTTPDSAEYYTSNVYDSGKNLIKNLKLYFNYDNTGVPPHPRELFFNRNITPTQNIVDNVINYELENNIEGTENLNIFTSFKNTQYIPSNISPTLGVFSKLKKLNYTSDDNIPIGSYKGFDSTTEPIPCSFIVSDVELENDEDQIGTETKNFYFTGQNRVIFRDPTDIDIILRYGSSEIVIYKEGEIQSDDTTIYENFSKLKNDPSHFLTENLWGFEDNNVGNITWIITDILDYDVNLELEYLEVKIHINAIADQAQIQKYNIARDKNYQWKLYVNNIYPLIYNNIKIGSPVDNGREATYLYNIYDASGIIAGTKRYGYDWSETLAEEEVDLTDYNIKLERTSYNKVLTKNYGVEEDGSGVYTILNVYDGFGALYKEYNTSDLTSEQTDYNTDYNVNQRGNFVKDYQVFDKINADIDIELPADINWYPMKKSLIDSDSIPKATPKYKKGPNPDYRTRGDIFPYFYNYNWFHMFFNMINYTKKGANMGSFWGKHFIKTPSDNQPLTQHSLPDYIYDWFPEGVTPFYPLEWVRPLFSGILKMNKSDASEPMFALNNLYLSTISKYSISNQFYYNTQEIEINEYAISNVWYNSNNEEIEEINKCKGSINLGADSIPFYPKFGDGNVLTTVDESDVRRITWPDWIREKGISSDDDIPQINNVFIRSEKGNFGAKMRYYVYAKINNKENLLFYFSADNEIQDLVDNQNVNLSMSSSEDNPSTEVLNKISNFKFQDLTNNLFMTMNSCGN